MYWTEEEDEVLREYFPTEGTNVCLRLSGRSRGACQRRARRLDVATRRAWSGAEDAVLKKYYPSEGGRVYLRLPGRNKCACQRRASELGIPSDSRAEPWTDAEDAVLKKTYPEKGAPGAAEALPGRTMQACRSRAMALGLRAGKNNVPWAEDEVQVLRQYYPGEGGAVSSRLPGRSREACTARANLLGIRYQGLSARFSPKDGLLALAGGKISQKELPDGTVCLTVDIAGTEMSFCVREGDARGLLVTDNGSVAGMAGSGPAAEKAVRLAAEASGLHYENGQVSCPCVLEDCPEKLSAAIRCASAVLLMRQMREMQEM